MTSVKSGGNAHHLLSCARPNRGGVCIGCEQTTRDTSKPRWQTGAGEPATGAPNSFPYAGGASEDLSDLQLGQNLQPPAEAGDATIIATTAPKSSFFITLSRRSHDLVTSFAETPASNHRIRVMWSAPPHRNRKRGDGVTSVMHVTPQLSSHCLQRQPSSGPPIARARQSFPADRLPDYRRRPRPLCVR
jgi:hypothetical protein